MGQAKLTVALVIAIVFQWIARSVSESLAYIDLPLIIVVYTALQGNTIRALFFATLAGLAVDALSGGLLGSNGFSKTLVAYLVSELVRRVYVENFLLRILVLMAAIIVDETVYYFMHRLLGQNINGLLFNVVSFTLLATTIVGIVFFLILDNLSLENMREAIKRNELFSPRRQPRRRNPIRLGKKV
ncbi:MAG: rod shape-determining protein MreD [Acidobacteria bacterium]|nr:MAG: rod shape-determining protein MreD [Acidobacteriota bacterium]